MPQAPRPQREKGEPPFSAAENDGWPTRQRKTRNFLVRRPVNRIWLGRSTGPKSETRITFPSPGSPWSSRAATSTLPHRKHRPQHPHRPRHRRQRLHLRRVRQTPRLSTKTKERPRRRTQRTKPLSTFRRTQPATRSLEIMRRPHHPPLTRPFRSRGWLRKLWLSTPRTGRSN